MRLRVIVSVVAVTVAAGKAGAQQPVPPPRADEQDPNTSRLFFAPTGRTLQAGTAELGDLWLFFPSIGVGFTDHVSVAAGVSIIPGANEQLLYILPKVGVVHSPTVNVAVGAIYMRLTGESGYGAGVYGAATFGTEDRAVTVSAGYPFANGDRTRDPMIMAGGELRIARQTKLMVEGWKLPGSDEVPIIFGFRFVGRRTAFDFGMMRVIGVETQGFPFIPWLGFSVGIN